MCDLIFDLHPMCLVVCKHNCAYFHCPFDTLSVRALEQINHCRRCSRIETWANSNKKIIQNWQGQLSQPFSPLGKLTQAKGYHQRNFLTWFDSLWRRSWLPFLRFSQNSVSSGIFFIIFLMRKKESHSYLMIGCWHPKRSTFFGKYISSWPDHVPLYHVQTLLRLESWFSTFLDVKFLLFGIKMSLAFQDVLDQY